MQNPILLVTCPDGHLDGPRARIVVDMDDIYRVRELPEDPGSPNLARTEVLLIHYDTVLGNADRRWVAIETPFLDFGARLERLARIKVAS